MEEEKSWLERNRKAVLIGGILVITALFFIPDAYLRKYVPWVK